MNFVNTLILLSISLITLPSIAMINHNDHACWSAKSGYCLFLDDHLKLGACPNKMHTIDKQSEYKAPLLSIVANNFMEGKSIESCYFVATHASAEQSYLRCVIELCDKTRKTDLNSKDSHNNTPLHNFIQRGITTGLGPDLLRAIKTIVSCGAQTKLTNKDNKTPCELAQTYLKSLTPLKKTLETKKSFVNRVANLFNSKDTKHEDTITQWNNLIDFLKKAEQKKETSEQNTIEIEK